MLVEQGQLGAELYLLLDGVVAVEVDGEPLAELGPGAILGERAVLEGGRRTSTLRAVARQVRVAVADCATRSTWTHLARAEPRGTGAKTERSAERDDEGDVLRRARFDAGVGPEFARVGGHTSCVALARRRRAARRSCSTRAPGSRPLRALFGAAPFRGTILLTHLHWDHVQGLPFFPPADRDDARGHAACSRRRATRSAMLARAMSPPHFPIPPDGLRGAWKYVGIEPGTHEFRRSTCARGRCSTRVVARSGTASPTGDVGRVRPRRARRQRRRDPRPRARRRPLRPWRTLRHRRIRTGRGLRPRHRRARGRDRGARRRPPPGPHAPRADAHGRSSRGHRGGRRRRRRVRRPRHRPRRRAPHADGFDLRLDHRCAGGRSAVTFSHDT